MADFPHEYRTVHTGAGWMRRRDHGWLRFTGADVLRFLQALVTNDVGSLPIGDGLYTAYLTPQGRMISDLALFHRSDDVMVATPASTAAQLAVLFDQLIFSEDVHVSDVSSGFAEFWIVGRDSAALLSAALSVDRAVIEPLSDLAHTPFGGGFISRSSDSVVPSFTVVVPESTAGSIAERMTSVGMSEISDALHEWLRIEAGRPKFGVDMNTETIPLEAGLLDRAISTTKGCYVGQEIIIRILHRGGGRVARRLVVLRLDDASQAMPGAGIVVDDRTVGQLTSVAKSPLDGSGLALGYVVRDMAELNRVFDISQTRGAVVAYAG